MTNLRRALISLVALSLLTCGTGFMKALADDTGETDRSLTEIHTDADSSSLNTVDMDAEAAAERQNMRAVEQNRGLEHFKIANYYTSRWDFRMAEVEFELAIMYYPTMKIAHRDYCLVSFARGQFLRSIAELLLVLGLGEPIPLNDTERAALKDRAAKIHSREGIADGRKGQWDMAIAEFKYALDNAPDNAAIERSLAFAYASKGDFDLAEQSYNKSFSEDPADGYSHADFAFLLADKGQGDQAMKQLSEAVKLEPKDAALHVDMGWMAESKNELSTAADEFKLACQLSPKHAGLWSHLGRIYVKLNDKEDAVKAFQAALKLDPTLDDVKGQLETLNATAQDDSGDNSKAESKAGTQTQDDVGSQTQDDVGTQTKDDVGSQTKAKNERESEKERASKSTQTN